MDSQSQATKSLPLLFQPISLRGVVSRNRVVVSPMCQYHSEDGGPTDWHLVSLGKYAIGGAGIIFAEETAIEARGRKTYECAGIYSDKHVQAYRRITDFLRGQGAVPAIQLGHSGRRASSDAPWTHFKPLGPADADRGLIPWTGISASPIPASRAGSQTPIALSVEDIKTLVATWTDAVKRSLDAGFEICEIHGAHGYLIHQFLSPLSNRRNDGYGGDLEGRMRFALEIVESARAAWPQDKPLFFRLSATDGAAGEWSMDDTVALSRALAERGVDVITCSSGGIGGPINTEIVPRVPGYHVPYCERVKREVGVKTLAVGLITEAEHAENILQTGQADLIALAREFLYNPHWTVHAAKALGIDGYLDIFPRDLWWWLKRREEVRNLKVG